MNKSMLVQQAINGYVVTFNGMTFVFKTLSEVCDFMYTEYEPKYTGAANVAITD